MRPFTLALLSVPILTTAAGASTVLITFTTLPSTYENSTYNGAVGGVFNAGTVAAQPFENLVCNDFLAVTYVPSGPDLYTEESIAGSSFEGAKFGSGDTTQYEEAALLIAGDGGALPGLSHAATPDEITSYQYAVWRLFTPDSAMSQELPSGDPVNFGTSSMLMGLALEDVGSGSRFQSIYDALRIYTPDPVPGGPQEFLQIDSSVPEPISMLLVGAGLIVVGCFSRRYVPRR